MGTLSRKFFAIGLLLALLVCSTGRAIPAYALADPEPKVFLNPVYNTEVYQFQDYVDTLTAPQFEILKIALGVFMATQAGANKYKLSTPYTSVSSVTEWLKNVGINAYNSIISLTPDTFIDPVTGNVVSTAQYKELIKFYVAHAMGAAVLAANYDTEQEFLDDIDNNENFFFSFKKDLQPSINSLVAINGGFYNWQFTESDWDQLTFKTANLSGSAKDVYLGYVNNLAHPNVLFSSTGNYKDVVSEYLGVIYLFFNTSTGYAYFVDESGQAIRQNYNIPKSFVYVIGNSPISATKNLRFQQYFFANDTRPYAEIVNDLFTRVSTNGLCFTVLDSGENCTPLYNTMISGVYYGVDWLSRSPITNNSDLNLLPNSQPYFDQIQNDYLLDIKGLLQDLLNTQDLYEPWVNNLYLPSGDIVIDPSLIQVSIDLTPITDLLAPPLPVNLNEIAEYTDNSYLDRVKEEARRGGNALAALVAFWHNCDAELIYCLFGAGITVLVGAFIGKWGHS